MVGDQLLTDNDRKEHLSLAYIRTIAAKVGYATGQYDIDRNSVDLLVSAAGDSMNPTVGMQMKATSSAEWKDGSLPFVLKRKNYDDLRSNSVFPKILVVFTLPSEEDDWLNWTEDRILVRRCAWWLSLKGYPPIESDSKTVYVPETQPLGPQQLTDIMERARRGQL